MGQFRLKSMNDPQDGTGRIKVREASDEGAELYITLDPHDALPPVELTDEEANRVRQFAVLEEVSDADAAKAKQQAERQATAGGQPPTYTKDELEGKPLRELQTIAQGRPGIEEVPTKKDDLVAVILADQEGVST